MTLETNKRLCGIGSLFIAIGFLIPFIGLVGIILLLVGLKGLSDDYNSPKIFQNALYGFIFGLIGIVILSITFITIAFRIILYSRIMDRIIIESSRIFNTNLILLILLFIVIFVLFLLKAIFYKKSFDIIAEKSGERIFNTIGILLIIGSILSPILIGYIVLIAAWIIATIGFFSIKT